MFALVESGSIIKFFSGNKGVTIEDIQYPKTIFSIWTEDERNEIGIFSVEIDNTNKKDEEYYYNTNITYSFDKDKVIGSYGLATPKNLDDEYDDDDKLVAYGLKSKKKQIIKQQASGLLAPTDWYVVKATEVEDYSVPSNITTFRADVRAKSNEMETAIDNATDVDALATLYAYVNTGTEENPVIERPLGEFPILEQ